MTSDPQALADFAVGDIVEKHTGDYNAIGEVRCVYTTPADKTRYMVALTRITKGSIMHTLAPENIRRASTPAPREAGQADAGVRAVSDNGKRWRIIPEDGDWEMVPVGHITAGQAKAICQRIEAALATPPPSAGTGEAVVCQTCEGTGYAFNQMDEREEECPDCERRLSAPPLPAAAVDWRYDPSADEQWNAGCDFATMQLCHFLGVDPATVDWDAATETLDGDVQSVIGKILRAKLGEDWGPSAPAPAVRSTEGWRDLDDARLQRAIAAFYEPCEGTTIDGLRNAILAWERG